MFSYRSISRTLTLLSRTQLGAPAPSSAGPFAGMTPLQTLKRSYSAQAPDPKDNEHPHEQSAPQAPSTEEIANSDAAFSGDTADPSKAKGQIESETNQSMNQSAANSKASEAPKKPLQTSKSDAQKSDTSKD